MAIIIQQDATEYSLFKSVNCSTCFRVVFHPSSGAHDTLSTVSGIEGGYLSWTWLGGKSRPVTFTTGSSNGLTYARYCRYSVMSSWWWVKYHPKHVEQLTDLNKLYSVASCWIIIAILYDARSIKHKIHLIFVFYQANCEAEAPSTAHFSI